MGSNKFKVKVDEFERQGLLSLYCAFAKIRQGILQTNNYTSEKYAKRAFILMCNRLSIPRDLYEFERKVKK